MTLILLIRHAAHDGVSETLSGRLPGIRLGALGRAQAERLAARLSRQRLDLIHASPRERCLETASALCRAGASGEPEIVAALDEVDFGAWSGRSFEQLNADPDWRRWNEQRSLARTPAGETMLDVQQRVVRHLERVAETAPAGVAALVSHAEPIRAAIAFVLGVSLDAWARLEIAPASINRIAFDASGARVCGVNETIP